MKGNRKALSILLSLMLAISLLAVPVFANPDDADGGDAAAVDTVLDTESEGSADVVSDTPETGAQEDADGQDPIVDEEEPSDMDGSAEEADPEEPGTGIEAEESGWIAVLEKPDNPDVIPVKAVVYRKGGRDGEIKVLESDLNDLTDEDFEAIKEGKLEIWNGWKYKKATQKIAASIDSAESVAGEYDLKYGSDAVALDAASEVKELSYATSNEKAVTVTDDGKIAPAGIGTAVISITAEGNEYYNTTVRKITVNVVKGDQEITADSDEYKVAIGTADFTVKAASNADDAGTLTYKVSEQASVDVDAETGTVSISDITSSPAIITVEAPETEHYEAAQKTIEVTVTKPATPKLKVAAIGGKKIKLTWTDAWTAPALPRDTSKVKYEVYCPQFSKKLRNGSTRNTYITSKTLKKNKKYKCKVRAVVTVGDKKYTTAWTAYVTSPKVK